MHVNVTLFKSALINNGDNEVVRFSTRSATCLYIKEHTVWCVTCPDQVKPIPYQ